MEETRSYQPIWDEIAKKNLIDIPAVPCAVGYNLPRTTSQKVCYAHKSFGFQT